VAGRRATHRSLAVACQASPCLLRTEFRTPPNKLLEWTILNSAQIGSDTFLAPKPSAASKPVSESGSFWHRIQELGVIPGGRPAS
jgi:hypothetical protein